MPSYAIYIFAMLFVGISIPIMAAVNARLGMHYENFAFAGVILFIVALVCAAFVSMFYGLPQEFPKAGIPVMYYFAGIGSALYILSITYVAPRFGVGNAMFVIFFGQMLSSLVVDHFGLFGAPKIEISWERVLGVCMMLGGLYLANKVGE